MRFAYADPPYLGCGAKHYSAHHPNASDYDKPEAHAALLERLRDEYPDGWALSLHTPSLEEMLHLSRRTFGPNAVRVGGWVKPFASFKPNVNPAYAWEPVLFRGGRKRTRQEPTVRDWVSANIMLKKGLTGAKPPAFCEWIFDLLGITASDTLDDLFPGTGVVSASLSIWRDRKAAA